MSDLTDVSSINKCFPKEWQTVDTTPVVQDDAPEEPVSTWTKILDGVQSVVEFICNFKDTIKGLFGKKVRRWARLKKYRMFTERSMRRYRRSIGWWSSIVHSVKSAAKAVGNAATNAYKAVKTTVVKAANAVVSWAGKAWNAVKEFGMKIVNNLKIFWDKMVNKITSFLNGDFVQKLLGMKACFDELKGVADAVIGVFKGAIERVSQIAQIVSGNLAQLANLFVELVCNFAIFRQAFTNLAQALNEKDTLKKWNLFGQFFGKLAKGITSGKRRRHYRIK